MADPAGFVVDYKIKMSIYEGVTDQMLKFINENIKYSKDAIKNKVEGRVFIKFVVLLI